jgi:hypothetical protein
LAERDNRVSIEHRGDYRVTFPEAVFEEDGFREKMLPSTFAFVGSLREMNGQPYPYTYELYPLSTRWMSFDCVVSVDVIDDKGDGKFRLMTSPGHLFWGLIDDEGADPPPVPDWLKKPQS